MMWCIRVLKAESGDSDPMENNNEENVEIKIKPLPSCGVITNSMDGPTWTNLVKDFGAVFEKTTNDLKALDVEMSDNISLFVQLQLASVYEQIYSCLPQFIEHPEGSQCEDYMEEEDTSEEPDKKEEVVTGLVNKVKKILEKVKTAISAWETKDSVLLVFTAPGILSALVLLLQLCMKRKIKRYTQELRNRRS